MGLSPEPALCRPGWGTGWAQALNPLVCVPKPWTRGVQARVGDGLVAAAELAAAVRAGDAAPLQLLVVDASSGDATQVRRKALNPEP